MDPGEGVFEFAFKFEFELNLFELVELAGRYKAGTLGLESSLLALVG